MINTVLNNYNALNLYIVSSNHFRDHSIFSNKNKILLTEIKGEHGLAIKFYGEIKLNNIFQGQT